MNEQLAADLKKAEAFHGHVCTGIVFGVRIARLGLSHLGIDDPSQNRDFMVFVEADRCLSDAVQSVTGCSLGRRRLKWYDYGKMAATFVDMNSKEGVRIITAAPQMDDGGDPIGFWDQYSDQQLFKVEPVTVDLKPEDLPGRPLRSIICEGCGEKVNDGRELQVDGRALCHACALGAYYQKR